MKRSAGRLFLRVFVMSLFIVGVLMLTVVVGYKAIQYFSQPEAKDPVPAYQDDVSSVNQEKEDTEGVSKNLIICYDKKTDEITKMVLEILNSNDNKLAYFTIPVRTQITLSDALYTKITLDDPKIPQLLKLSTLTKYLDSEKAYEDEALIVEELLNLSINYYTAMPTKTFEKMFTEKSKKQSDGYDSVPMEIYTNEYKNKINSFDSKMDFEKDMKKIYKEIKTNLPLEEKLKLIDSYAGVPMNEVEFDLISGSNTNSAYIIDEGHAAQQLIKITGDTVN